jgi:hypothetical protein
MLIPAAAGLAASPLGEIIEFRRRQPCAGDDQDEETDGGCVEEQASAKRVRVMRCQ